MIPDNMACLQTWPRPSEIDETTTMSGKHPPLKRNEAKAVTHRRLLDAALVILDEEGDAKLTTTAITSRAGVAQSTFYAHFADVNDLLHELIDDLVAERRRSTRQARHLSQVDRGRLRDTYRIPLLALVAHPAILRLTLKSRHDRFTPLGEWSRDQHERSRQALIEDMASAGFPNGSPAEQLTLAMTADGIIAITDQLALGHVEGRYPDLEQIIDVLIMFYGGWRDLRLAAREVGHRDAPGDYE
jgi:AcrR family transcriptional regulator